MRKMQFILLSLIFSIMSCSTTGKVEDVAKGIDTNILASSSHKLESTQDLDVLLKEIGNSRYVLLGEASHGTKEYYTWRAEITKRLIEEKGFNIVAVEGDWPDLYKLNQYAKNSGATAASARAIMQDFDRWPTWMWANEETADLMEWMRNYNSGKGDNSKAGFYGMDVYSLWDSLDELERYLQQTDPALVKKVQDVKACFAPYGKDEQAYGRATYYGSANCAGELNNLLKAVQQHASRQTTEAAFNAEQNALIAKNAERYYKEMYRSNAGSWNLRDRHMMETINRLVQHHGPNAKVVIWAHNTHVGDARATDMRQSGMINIGQLVREQHKAEGVYAVGFGSYNGTVMAAYGWGAPRQVMGMPPAMAGSWEAILHKIEPANKIVLLQNLKTENVYRQMIGHRAIGVSYNPAQERGNYVPSILPERYDAFIFIDKTQALTPVSVAEAPPVAEPDPSLQ